MTDDPRKYLWDIQKASDSIARFTLNLDQDAYRADERTRSAVERKFEIIGEALNQLSRNSPDVARRIPDLPSIVAFRNLLIHGYATVDDRNVWLNIQQNCLGWLPRWIKFWMNLAGRTNDGARAMLKEFETHREQIAGLCRRYGVKRLELFGSAAR